MNNIVELKDKSVSSLWPVEGISFIRGLPEAGRTWKGVHLAALPTLYGQMLIKLDPSMSTIRIRTNYYLDGNTPKADIKIIEFGDDMIVLYAQSCKLYAIYAQSILDTYNDKKLACPDIDVIIMKEGYYWEDVPRSF